MSTVAIGVTDDASAPADDGGTYEEVENEEKIDKRKTTSLSALPVHVLLVPQVTGCNK